MLFALDIDGTLAIDKGNRLCRAFIARDLGLSADECTASARLTTIPAERQRAALESALRSPEVMSKLEPIHGALAGIKLFASLGDILYVSCRAPALHDTTVAWLNRHGFPHPERVCLCDAPQAKYTCVAESSRGEPIVLVDDRAEQLVRAFRLLASERPDVALRLTPLLTVLAFNAKQSRWRMSPPPFPVYVLSSWEQAYLKRLMRAVAPALAK